MRFRHCTILSLVVLLAANAAPAFSPGALAQPNQMKDDFEQLAMDLHVGVDRSTLTEQQKAQLRDDFRELKQAHQNHQMFAALRAARSIRAALDSGAFKSEDQQRIKQDMQAIKEARENQGAPGGSGL